LRGDFQECAQIQVAHLAYLDREGRRHKGRCRLWRRGYFDGILEKRRFIGWGFGREM